MSDPSETIRGELGQRARNRQLLGYLGLALLAGGQPAHDTAEDVRQVATQLGHPDCQVVVLPESITVSLAGGEPATVEGLRTTLTLDQLAAVRELRRQILDGALDCDQAIAGLRTIRGQGRRYGRWGIPVGLAMVAVGIAMIMQPGWPNVVFAAVCSQVVTGLMLLTRRHPLLSNLLPSVAAFVVAVAAFTAADLGLIEGPLRSVLPPLAVLLPGALLVTGLSELAAGAMVAGTARLAYGTVKLLLFTVGVVAAGWALQVPAGAYSPDPVPAFWVGEPFVGIVLISVGILLFESVSTTLWGWVVLVLLATFAAEWVTGGSGGVLGGFIGGMVASAGATLVEVVRPNVPRLVVFLPSFWLLVPGTLGLLSISQLGGDAVTALRTTLAVGTLICAIALGLLVGSVLVRPAQRWRLRRDRRILG